MAMMQARIRHQSRMKKNGWRQDFGISLNTERPEKPLARPAPAEFFDREPKCCSRIEVNSMGGCFVFHEPRPS